MPDPASPDIEPIVPSQEPPRAAKAPARRLGRGLSSLLGAAAKPVPVDVPRGTSVSPPLQSPIETAQDRRSGPVGPPAAAAGDDRVPGSDDTASPTGVGLERFVFLEPKQVQRNPRQPREQFDDAPLRALAESIRLNGVMQPIVVRLVPNGYELVAGERRLRASNLVGLAKIPAIVRDLDNQQSAEWALIENLQREDLNPLERARGLHRLIQEFSLSHQQAAERVGLERASVSNLLRLLELDSGTATLVAAGSLGQGHAKVLLAIPDVAVRRSVAQMAVDRQWSVRRLEAEVRRLLAPAETPAPSLMPREATRTRTQLDDLERRLSEHLGTRVQILTGRRKGQGRLVVDFHSLEHFDDLMSRIGFASD